MSISDVTENATKFVEIRPTIEQLINAIRPINEQNVHEDLQNILQNDINQLIRCTLCNKKFKNRGSALFHTKKTHSLKISSDINSILGINQTTKEDLKKLHFFCPFEFCNKKLKNNNKYFSSTKLLIQHFQKTHFDKKLKCNFCTAKFALERDLRYHIKKVCPKLRGEINDKNNFKNKIDKNIINVKNASSQTENWLVPTKIILAGKFCKIHPKRKITTEKHNYTQTELMQQYTQQKQKIQSEEIILNNYQQNNNNNINLINNQQQQQQYLNNQNNNFILNNNNNFYQQTVEESTQTFYGCCYCCSSSSFINENNNNNIGEGESLLRNNGWTQTPPFYPSFEPCNNLMEMQSTSAQTEDTIIPSIWNL